MNKNKRLIILSILSVLIVVLVTIGVTTAFMKPIEDGGNLTSVSLSSCAKITLEGTNSISLSNSYPMSRNRALQTTPYTFKVTTSCDTYVGFNLYLATLSSNTLEASNIHYIITNKGSKEALAEGTLTTSLEVSDFSDAEITELNAGLGSSYGKIYKLFNEKVPYQGSVEYDLYLYVDESVTSASGTFQAGVAIKSYEREKDVTLADVCPDGGNLAECVKKLSVWGSEETNLYYHDSTLANGAGDNSYRYAGPSDTTNNYVCFGSDADTCPNDNLYRIIGVFDGRVRLIKADYANSDLLGTDGDHSSGTGSTSSYTNYTGSKTTIDLYYWNSENYSASNTATGYYNDWSYSQLNTVNLNTNYLTNIGTEWANMIDKTTWKVGGNTNANIYNSNANTAYTNEITSPSTQVTSTYDSKVGLMYVSDYYYGASPTYWTYQGNNSSDSSKDYRTAIGENWMFLGIGEWTMVRSSSYSGYAFDVNSTGYVYSDPVILVTGAVRPVFHLTSKVEVLAGNGTLESPLRISGKQ